MNQITTILFDMDGTLYQDFDFHRPYLSYILEGRVSGQFVESATILADRILEGSSIPMNRFYRAARVIEGTPANVEELEEAMKAGLIEDMPFDFCYENGLGDLHYLGDPWEVVTYMAAVLGVSEEMGEYAFCRVREEMHEKTIQRNESLLQVLHGLKEKYETILLSNSPEKSASDFIDKLGFSDAFTAKFYDARKPYGLLARIYKERPQLKGNMNQVVSVGDHAFNEIVNISKVGGHTIWMNPYQDAPQIPCSMRVRDIQELMEVLQREPLF